MTSLIRRIAHTPLCRPFLYWYRKQRLMRKGRKRLPSRVHITAGSRTVWLETKNWQTSQPCMDWTTSEGEFAYEPQETKVFKDIARGADTVFDIGANIGYYSLMAAAMGAKKIVAFEIEDAYTEELKRHAKTNNIDTIEIVDDPIGRSGQIIEIENFSALTKKRARSLDDFCKEKGYRPDVIKCDIEGYEYDALRGGAGIIRSAQPKILLGLHANLLKTLGQSAEKVVNMLHAWGYTIYPIMPSTHAHAQGPAIAKHTDIPEEVKNIVCLPSPPSSSH